jgi:hypothetical protein
MDRTTAIEFLSKMPDVKMVGAAEYRVLHELLTDIAESAEQADDAGSLMLSALAEVEDWTKRITRELRTAISGVRLDYTKAEPFVAVVEPGKVYVFVRQEGLDRAHEVAGPFPATDEAEAWMEEPMFGCPHCKSADIRTRETLSGACDIIRWQVTGEVGDYSGETQIFWDSQEGDGFCCRSCDADFDTPVAITTEIEMVVE